MKKEYMKKHLQSVSGLFALQSYSITQRSTSGLTRGSKSNQSALLLSVDSRVKPENDGIKNKVKPEGGSMENSFSCNKGRLVGGNMKRIFSEAVLTLCSVLFLSGAANAACYDKTCADMGYTLAAGDCESNGGIVKCPFDTSKVFCMQKEQTCAVGDIYYSDGTCEANIIAGKTPVGVVGYLTDGGKHGGVIALEEKSLKWSNIYNDLTCLPDLDGNKATVDIDGKSNTACIISQTNDVYPAAEYCNSYKPVSSGKGSLGWYLPASGELKMISSSYSTINLSLQRLAKTNLSSSYYWSSSEYNYNHSAWAVRLSDGDFGHAYVKYGTNRVRCALGF